MTPQQSDRRQFLKSSVAAGTLAAVASSKALASPTSPARSKVVVWDERQPAQKSAYPNFLGNAIADHLRKRDTLDVVSTSLDEPNQGLSANVLDQARVLIWWGHVRHAEITPETGKSIVARIKNDGLSLIAIHSAHWATPFVEAMNERSRMDVARRYPARSGVTVDVNEIAPPRRYTLPKYDTRLTPYTVERKFPDGRIKIDLHLPYCVFPSYRGDGKPSQVRVSAPDHPITRGLPPEFEIPQTEMYDEPFHVPEPDLVLFEERWTPGEWFRSGMLWRLGKGHILYLRPGHETYPIYRQERPLQILDNAVQWLTSQS